MQHNLDPRYILYVHLGMCPIKIMTLILELLLYKQNTNMHVLRNPNPKYENGF